MVLGEGAAQCLPAKSPRVIVRHAVYLSKEASIAAKSASIDRAKAAIDMHADPWSLMIDPPVDNADSDKAVLLLDRSELRRFHLNCVFADDCAAA